MKLFTQKRFFQSSLLLLFLLGSTLWVRADETSDSVSLYGEEDYSCAAELSSEVLPVLEQYESVMDQYTKVDTPSSEQFENAFLLYRYVEDQIVDKYQASATISGYNKSLNFSNEELSVCRKMRDSMITYARHFLSIFISDTTTSKTTFKFVDGLKVMNEDLKEMSLLFQSTFPGQLKEMSNALPCYAHQCLSK